MRVDFYWSQSHYADHLRPIADWLDVLGIEVHGYHPQSAEPPADDGTPTIIAGHGDLKHIPQSRPVALVSHGVDQTYEGVDHGAYAGGKDRERYDLFLCPSERSADLNFTRYPNARAVPVGPVRLDGLLGQAHITNVGPDSVYGLAWHHDSGIAPETRSAFPYYAATIQRLARDGTHFVGHGHPRDHDAWQRQYDVLGVRYEPDVERFLAFIDLLAADNTSLLYEAAALGVPTLSLDAPYYRTDVNHGLRFWDAVPGWRLGARPDTPHQVGLYPVAGRDALAGALECALRDEHGVGQLARERALAVAYGDADGTPLLDGKAGERAAKAVVSWITGT